MHPTRARRLPDFGYHGRRYARWKIWQAGFFDRVLDEAEDVRQVIAYILMNPVRAGLVDDPRDYPYSGSGTCDLADLLERVHRYL